MTTGLVTAIIILMMTSFTLSANVASLNIDIDQYKEDKLECATEILEHETSIENKIDEINNLQNQLDNYECPEPDIIYINTTEYIYETFYLENRIYDVDRNGIINYNDACEVLYYVNHDPRWIEQKCYDLCGNCWELLYDVNCDGKVNISDVDDIWHYCD